VREDETPPRRSRVMRRSTSHCVCHRRIFCGRGRRVVFRWHEPVRSRRGYFGIQKSIEIVVMVTARWAGSIAGDPGSHCAHVLPEVLRNGEPAVVGIGMINLLAGLLVVMIAARSGPQDCWAEWELCREGRGSGGARRRQEGPGCRHDRTESG